MDQSTYANERGYGVSEKSQPSFTTELNQSLFSTETAIEEEKYKDWFKPEKRNTPRFTKLKNLLLSLLK